MNSLDQRLANGLHGIVDGEPDSAPPVGLLLERGRQARRRRASTVVTATCAALAVGALGVASVAQMPTSPRPGVAAQASSPQLQSPRMKLMSAAEASANISYRIRVKTNLLAGEGAFDPRTDTGYFRVPQDDSVQTELLINGIRYEGGERPLGKLPADKGPEHETYGRYGQYPGNYDHLDLAGELAGPVLGATAPEPAELLKALQEANATTTENPDGTLHFEFGTKSKDGSSTTSGDVTLDADGRIAKVAFTFTWQSTAKGRLDTGKVSGTLELSDYGTDVKVKRPTDVVMAK
ncbi:hypothetical protein ACL02O_31740 [Micromonospora sp. MS34]|uniref:hypothetical protein n=1 Tax=Micromonospora sp. MS34 TaxID=3385971 RepID=UPI0039A12CF2